MVKYVFILLTLVVISVLRVSKQRIKVLITPSSDNTLFSGATANISAITLRAHAAWKEARQGGIEETTSDKEEHFTFSLYDQPVGTLSYFNIQLKNSANSSYFITGRIGSDLDTSALKDSLMIHSKCIERVVCIIPRIKFNAHFAHFAQAAFPCWSALQRFPKNMRYIKSFAKPSEDWIGQLVAVFEKAGITILPMDSQDFTGIDDCDWVLNFVGQNSTAWPESPTLKYDTDGSLLLNHNDYKWRKNSIKYFSRQSDIVALQYAVLGLDYISGASKKPKVQILILNRGGTRHLSNGEDIASSIQDSVLGDIIDLKYVENMSGSLHHQALTVHLADIIISPHGAQLTNLAFIKPCTVVVEIFPRGYYLQFFQSYVVAAGGIVFEGYEDGRSPYFDVLGVSDGDVRQKRRSLSIPMSAASVLRALPDFILKFNTCRINDEQLK